MDSERHSAPTTAANYPQSNPGIDNRRSPSVWQTLLTCIGLACSVLLIYGRTIEFKFVNFDDDVHVTENEHVTSGLTFSNLQWDFGIHGPSQWHPLAWISHQLDCTWFGLNPGGHHATSVALHLLASILLYWSVQALLKEWEIAAFTAAAFAEHPLNVESVAWVSERRTVLCAVFFFLTILAYTNYVKTPTRWRYLLVLLGHAAALMSKPLAVTLPCVPLLLDFGPLNRWSRVNAAAHPQTSAVKLIAEKIPLFVLSGIASVLTILCQHAVGTIATFTAIPPTLRITNAIAAYGWYLQKLIWPVNLGVFYPHPALVGKEPWTALTFPALVAAAVLVSLTVITFRYRRQLPWLWLGWLWYLGVMVPMIGVIQVGEQQQADRYAYLPMIGLLLMLGCVGSQIARSSRTLRHGIALIGLIILTGWGIAAYRQVSYWKTSVTLFSHTIAVTERNHWAHNNLGFALLRQGHTPDAARQFQLAIQAVPDYGLAHLNLGVALQEMGQDDSARAEYEMALRLDLGNSQAHQQLAAMQMQSGEFAEAIAHFREAVRLLPDDGTARFNLGLALAKTGQPIEAIQWFKIAHRLQPNHLETVLGLAMALRDLNRVTESVELLKIFVKENPNSSKAESLLMEMLQSASSG